MKITKVTYYKEFKKGLEDSDIEYVDIDADSSGEEADRVENLLNSNQYPLVCIEKGNLHTYIRPGLEGETLLNNLLILNYCSIPHLLTLVKKHI